jgi:hypothetical protein
LLQVSLPYYKGSVVKNVASKDGQIKEDEMALATWGMRNAYKI